MLDLDFSKTGFWNIKELKYLQDTKALEEIKKYQIAPIAFWKPFKKVLQANPSIFPDKLIDKNLFFGVMR